MIKFNKLILLKMVKIHMHMLMQLWWEECKLVQSILQQLEFNLKLLKSFTTMDFNQQLLFLNKSSSIM